MTATELPAIGGILHLRLTVRDMNRSRGDLDRAARYLDQHGVPRGEIRELGSELGIAVMAFRDPDNIQLELTAPAAL